MCHSGGMIAALRASRAENGSSWREMLSTSLSGVLPVTPEQGNILHTKTRVLIWMKLVLDKLHASHHFPEGTRIMICPLRIRHVKIAKESQISKSSGVSSNHTIVDDVPL